jgi:hypothetical protein
MASACMAGYAYTKEDVGTLFNMGTTENFSSITIYLVCEMVSKMTSNTTPERVQVNVSSLHSSPRLTNSISIRKQSSYQT